LSSLTVTLILGGTNSNAYTLSNTNININIISNVATNVAPTCTLVAKNLQKTYAGFEVTANIPGSIFY
jgi:UDP-N-acetylenolpyruvoylglucosamine reductase